MSPKNVSIIAIGSELLSGEVQDSNSSFLASELQARGFSVIRICVVDDIEEQILEALRDASATSELIFTIGGLGPTSDDLTRESLARAAGEPLTEDSGSRERLELYAKNRGRVLNENSLKQALFPKGSRVMENKQGTADAFVTEIPKEERHCPAISLPGPPRELKALFEAEVLPWLSERFPKYQSAPKLCFRCFGLSESHVGFCIDSCSLPEGVSVAYRPQFPELLVTLSAPGINAEDPKTIKKLEKAYLTVSQAIGEEFIFTQNAYENLPATVGALLSSRGLTLAAAESCTGGLFAHRMVSSPGASDYFLASLVTYSNTAKEVFAGVKPSLLSHVGAVSAETAKAMAYGAKSRIGADIAVSITGIAGPDGGSDEKPIGTVWIGLAAGGEVEAFHHLLPFDRNAIRIYSAALATDLVRRKILDYPSTWEKR